MGIMLLVGASAAGADGDVPLTELGVALPAAVGGLRNTGRHEFGGGLGYGVSYNSERSAVTLYVYDRGRAGIP